MGSASERFNPRRWKREAKEERERERWNALTPEEQQAELDARAVRMAQWAEERRIQAEKEEKLLVKYMKVANTITIDDFFKTESPLRARVTAFCTIRGYTPSQTEKAVEKALRLFKATRWRSHGYTREGAVDLMKMELHHICHSPFTHM